MPSFDEDMINVTGLEKLAKSLKKERIPVARVGIIGDKNKPHYASLENGQKPPKRIPTNAEVGAVHEFGSPARGIPQRSFLRIPISDNLDKYMQNAGAFDADTLNEVLQKGTLRPWVKKLAVLAERIVADAFSTGGFGKWFSWKKANYTNNANQILVDTGQLRNSITSEVK